MQEKNKKEIIISSAAKIFAEKGKSGARMKDIAESAGVSSALLHYHYKSKDELYYEVLKYYLVLKSKYIININTKPKEEITYKDFFSKEAIANLIKAYDEFFKKNIYFTKLLIQELSIDSKVLKNLFTEIKPEHKKKEKENIKFFFRKAIEEGLIREIDPMHTWISILILILGQYTYESFLEIILDQNNIDKKKFKNDRINIIIEQVWNMIKK